MRDLKSYANVLCDIDEIVGAMAKTFDNYEEDSASWMWDYGMIRIHVMDKAWHSYNKSVSLEDLLKWGDKHGID